MYVFAHITHHENFLRHQFYKVSFVGEVPAEIKEMETKKYPFYEEPLRLLGEHGFNLCDTAYLPSGTGYKYFWLSKKME